MRKVRFVVIGTAETGVSKVGNSYIHLRLDPEKVGRMAEHDVANGIYLFEKKGVSLFKEPKAWGKKQFEVCGPVAGIKLEE